MNIKVNFLAVSALCSLAISAFAHDEIFAGRYVWGAEVDTFRPCDSTSVYWTSYNWAGLKLREYYQTIVTKPYSPIFVRFRGHFLNEETDGFAANYDGLIHISEVLESTTVIPASCG